MFGQHGVEQGPFNDLYLKVRGKVAALLAGSDEPDIGNCLFRALDLIKPVYQSVFAEINQSPNGNALLEYMVMISISLNIIQLGIFVGAIVYLCKRSSARKARRPRNARREAESVV